MGGLGLCEQLLVLCCSCCMAGKQGVAVLLWQVKWVHFHIAVKPIFVSSMHNFAHSGKQLYSFWVWQMTGAVDSHTGRLLASAISGNHSQPLKKISKWNYNGIHLLPSKHCSILYVTEIRKVWQKTTFPRHTCGNFFVQYCLEGTSVHYTAAWVFISTSD